jgi:hypothetical protein
MFGGSGNAPIAESTLANPTPKTAYFLDQLADTDALPAWLTEADLDFFTAEFTRRGFRGGLNWYRNFGPVGRYRRPFKARRSSNRPCSSAATAT